MVGEVALNGLLVSGVLVNHKRLEADVARVTWLLGAEKVYHHLTIPNYRHDLPRQKQ